MSSSLLKKGSGLIVLIFVLTLLFAGCDMVGPEVLEDSPSQVEEESFEVEVEAFEEVRVEEDMYNVLVGFTHSPGEAEKELIGNLGGEVKRSFNIVDAMEINIPENALAVLGNSEIVRYVEPNAEVEAHQTVPWGIDRVFGDEKYSFDTWNEADGQGVGVAILDTGIDEDHESLPEPQDGTNTIDDTHWGDDGNGHGTHVAGTVAALDNDTGVVGVGPEIDLYAVKVLDDGGGGTWSSVAAGIEWAVKEDIPILNMSLGGGDSETLRESVEEARNEGHLIIASAGNDGNPGGRGDNVGYPAAYDEVIAVAASDDNDNRASFSSTGPQVELIAPGVNVLSTVPGDDYEEYSGTSMSAPHVAGVAALVWDAEGAELGDNEDIRVILQETAEDLGLDDEHQGYGLVRADKAVAFDDGEDEDEEDEDLAEPVIKEFDITTRTSGPWNRADVEWTVSHEDEALAEVKSELLDGDDVVDTETTSVIGGEASGEHNLRTRGEADSVRLTVTDNEGNKTSETKEIEF